MDVKKSIETQRHVKVINKVFCIINRGDVIFRGTVFQKVLMNHVICSPLYKLETSNSISHFCLHLSCAAILKFVSTN